MFFTIYIFHFPCSLNGSSVPTGLFFLEIVEGVNSFLLPRENYEKEDGYYKYVHTIKRKQTFTLELSPHFKTWFAILV